MFIKCISDGLVQSNVYIVGGNGEGIIIDCGCPADNILKTIKANDLTAKHVILTHGHFDHFYYINALRNQTDVTVHIHEQDADYLSDPLLNGLALFSMDGVYKFSPADNLLKNGDILKSGGLKFQILHTPGHTKGGICIYVENCVFTGDTLFKSSIGRTDFPGGSMNSIEKSIKEKLYTLPENTVVYPGHGKSTTIGFEKKNNPYVRV